MPQRHGEERVLNVFADIHYYFSPPTPKPIHHRFDKGSYLYVYRNHHQNSSRLEIANNPGTPDQDAFEGSFHNAHIRHSVRFGSHCTLTVNARPGSGSLRGEWQLPILDPSSRQHNVALLHTLDIYFWSKEDSNLFLDIVSRFLSPDQIETDRAPDLQISSVVQKLENVAVSDPAYQNGQTRNSRSEPLAPVSVAAVSSVQTTPQSLSFPPPPAGLVAEQQETQNSVYQTPTEEKRDSGAFAPLPYNPAAPAAPEPIKHREKTPPPEDGAAGTGLAAAAAADQGQGLGYPSQPQGPSVVGISSFAPPPTSVQGIPYSNVPTGYASPPPSAGLPYQTSFGPTMQNPGFPSYQQPFHSVIGSQWNPGTPASISMTPQDHNAYMYGQQMPGTSQQSSLQRSATLPIGGYSNSSEAQSQPQPKQAETSEYDIHSQVYRPTEVEFGSQAGIEKYAKKSSKNSSRPRKLEDKAEKLESRANRFLKKLEKKL
ncbi:hypothetical protein N7495_008354 [Penicillium taxi]|uniref:uncharacterized protein n=1 Tax=Penicillium taxi TaxID=168475 RepID=UPI0025454F3F|nr:uncharacterized protein N7495_008354 [Penicillium taxi]KAJ5888313.1 hypothetical protein N7495_008354 [Penicillium taxi]